MIEKREIVYYRESALQSIIADLFTFIFLGILFAFNHFYLDDSKVAGFFFFIVFLAYALSTTDRKHIFTNKEELIKHLQKGH